jgi:hypothetical protein
MAAAWCTYAKYPAGGEHERETQKSVAKAGFAECGHARASISMMT